MSGENLDSDNARSRSIFRQVRETISGKNRNRHQGNVRTGSPILTLVKTKCESADNIDTHNLQTKFQLNKPAPIAYSHHRSLLNQVKSHITKNRKNHQTTLSSYMENDDYTHLSLPTPIFILVSYFFL
jgi:hypothetical protein